MKRLVILATFFLFAFSIFANSEEMHPNYELALKNKEYLNTKTYRDVPYFPVRKGDLFTTEKRVREIAEMIISCLKNRCIFVGVDCNYTFRRAYATKMLNST